MFSSKKKSGYHIFTEKCAKNNKKVKGHVYAIPVVYTTVYSNCRLYLDWYSALHIVVIVTRGTRIQSAHIVSVVNTQTITEFLDSIATRCTSTSKIVNKFEENAY